VDESGKESHMRHVQLLTDRKVTNLKARGRYHDGLGLYLYSQMVSKFELHYGSGRAEGRNRLKVAKEILSLL
jgi:hypothetical protein